MTKDNTVICGLLGRTLGHSYSPRIHSMLGDYSYCLFEKESNELEAFLSDGNWQGLNVTIPYKKDVVPYCSCLSEAAQAIQSVNTLVRRPDGRICGDNTDAFGFACLLDHNHIDVKGNKVLILGNGGACASVKYILETRGADVVVISRKGADNYTNLERHQDAALIVNTTPVGMFPNNGEQAVSLTLFPYLKAVLDLIYNPARTALMLQAEQLGILTDNGLYMLVAQAYASSIQFLNPEGLSREHPEKARDVINRIYLELADQMQNIVLIGMPGCGKSVVARALGTLTGRDVLDLDDVFETTYGISPGQCITGKGEETFRRMESKVIAEAGKYSGKILATGGGCVTVSDNYPLLHQNGRIVWLRRDLSRLCCDGRPISQQMGTEALYKTRKPMYERFADFIVDNDKTPQDAARKILELLRP